MASDYYQVLGLCPSVEQELIEKAYRVLALKYHPDRSGRDQAGRFQRICEAYEVLGSPRLRRLYDQGQLPGRTRGRDCGGADAFQILNLRFEQAARGGAVRFWRISESPHRSFNEPLQVRVPPAVEDGQRLRLPAMGQPAIQSGPPGDLILIVAIEPHPHMHRKGLDLYVDVDVPLDVAIHSGRVDVWTLQGLRPITIPAGANGGDTLRLRAAGLRNDRKQQGDLFAVLHIKMPSQSTQPTTAAADAK